LAAQLMRVSRDARLSIVPRHDDRPLHSNKQLSADPPQAMSSAQLPAPRQRTLHSTALQRSSPSQDLRPSQRTSQASPLHCTSPAHDSSPVQSTSQRDALPQLTPSRHDPGDEHRTRHGTPFGHTMPSLQGSSASQVTTHTPLSHSPMP
jgi:hypothetical protein